MYESCMTAINHCINHCMLKVFTQVLWYLWTCYRKNDVEAVMLSSGSKTNLAPYLLCLVFHKIFFKFSEIKSAWPWLTTNMMVARFCEILLKDPLCVETAHKYMIRKADMWDFYSRHISWVKAYMTIIVYVDIYILLIICALSVHVYVIL